MSDEPFEVFGIHEARQRQMAQYWIGPLIDRLEKEADGKIPPGELLALMAALITSVFTLAAAMDGPFTKPEGVRILLQTLDMEWSKEKQLFKIRQKT